MEDITGRSRVADQCARRDRAAEKGDTLGITVGDTETAVVEDFAAAGAGNTETAAIFPDAAREEAPE